jgi:GTP pyrophosphokinase
VSTQNVLGSTNTFGGGPDLDARPAEMARSALWAEIQECPSCGFCASEIGAAPETVARSLGSPRYLDTRQASEPCELARQYLLASFVSEDAGAFSDSGWMAVQAAWSCDDDEDAAGASRCRERAVEQFRAATVAGQGFAEDRAVESAILADVLRRCGRFHEATAICEVGLAAAEGVVASVLTFEGTLARAGDDSARTVEEALEAVPVDDEAEPLDLGPQFEAAVALALEIHRAQPRKGTRIPYAAHLLGVVSLVLEDGGSEEEAIAALLHDAVEDGGGAPMLEGIRGTFGDGVAEIVAGCSDTDEDPKPPWRARKEEYIAHLPDASASVIRVSLADKLHNARAITRDLRTHGEEVWRRFKPESDQLWYYRTLANTYRQISDSPMVADLEREADELELLAIVSGLRRLMAFHDLEDYAGQFVIVRGDDARNYFVQFAVDRGGLFCEAVHNMYLEDEYKLTGDQVGELLALGWNPPDHPGQNLYRTFFPTGDADLREIASLAIQVLRDVYRVSGDQPIGISTSWRDDEKGDRSLVALPDEPFDFTDYLATVDLAPVGGSDPAPVALFVAGGALSGSRGVFGQLAEEGDDLVPAEAAVVDPSAIRQLLPEWEQLLAAGEPDAAAVVREETLDVSREVVEEAARLGRNLVLMGLGAGGEGDFVGVMRRFADAGYEIRVLLVDAPVELELERNEIRARETALRFDPDTVADLSVEAVQRFSEWREEPWLTFVLYSVGR